VINEQVEDERRDQTFTRPRVLILAPFKQTAYQIIEQIIMYCNQGKWKKVSKKKKFRDEFGQEEDAFNDFFRIGISINWNKTGKMSLKLYE
jgi:U3 small nucleolar RNA-associated protein 25